MKRILYILATLAMVALTAQAAPLYRADVVDAVPFNTAVALGAVDGYTSINKFGATPDFDQDDGEVAIWDAANDAVAFNAMTYTYSTTADIDSLASSSASDIGSIEVQGLTAALAAVTQTITLTGQTRVALTTPLMRVFRMKNVGSTNFVGNVSCYVTNSPTSSGVVTDSSHVRAAVLIGNNQTQMAIYTVAAGKKLSIESLYAYSAGASKTADYVIRLYARPTGEVFQLKFEAAIIDGDSAYLEHPYPCPLVFAAGTDIEMRVEIPAGTADSAYITAGFSGCLADN